MLFPFALASLIAPLITASLALVLIPLKGIFLPIAFQALAIPVALATVVAPPIADPAPLTPKEPSPLSPETPNPSAAPTAPEANANPPEPYPALVVVSWLGIPEIEIKYPAISLTLPIT